MAYSDIEKRRAWFRERYRRNCEFVQKYKIEKGCSDCGWNKHHSGLEFDHIGSKVRDRVASVMGRSLKVIMEEIEVCDVVCSRCHSIRTWNRAHPDDMAPLCIG